MFVVGRVVKDYNPLTFIAETPNSSILLNKNGRYHPIELRYRLSSSANWEIYELETLIPLNNVGDYVQFQSDYSLTPSERFYVNFVMEGTIRATGNIQSLMNYTDICSNWCYYRLFINCTSLIEAPKLTATTLANNCYKEMFSGCTELITAPKLPATELVESCYLNMFNGCTKLNSVTVNFTDWSDTTKTSGWLTNVNENGVFNCPASLFIPEIRNESTVPAQWKINKK